MTRQPFDPDRIGKQNTGGAARRERAKQGEDFSKDDASNPAAGLPSASDFAPPSGFEYGQKPVVSPSSGSNTPSKEGGESAVSRWSKKVKPQPTQASPSPIKPGGERQPMSVSELSDLVKDVFSRHVPGALVVTGEVSNFSERRHWYLTLKDANSKIDAVMWASALKKCKFRPEHGQQVVATGRLDYYGPQGRLQLYIDKLEPAGIGELEQRYRALLDDLRVKGYFREDRKKALPVFPRKVAIVTSRKAAALQDIIRTTANRWRGCQLYLVDVRVQGGSAAPDVARAIRWLDHEAERLELDAMVITRGGGSLEDLWAFNELEVAEAVYRAKLPVVAAIGHETDTTIAELVADLRCSTPTQAAERLIPDARAEWQQLDQLDRRLNHTTGRYLAYLSSELARLSGHPLFSRPEYRVKSEQDRLIAAERHLQGLMRERMMGEARQLDRTANTLEQLRPQHRLVMERERLSSLERRMKEAVDRKLSPQSGELTYIEKRLNQHMANELKQASSALRSMERELESISPKRVLERGYSYTTDEKGKVIRSVGQVKAGDVLMAHFQDGTVPTQALKDPSSKGILQGKVKRSRKKKAADSDDQAGLFG